MARRPRLSDRTRVMVAWKDQPNGFVFHLVADGCTRFTVRRAGQALAGLE